MIQAKTLTMTDYQKIYDDVSRTNPKYGLAENSPGLRACIQASSQLAMLSGRALDFGCGSGFVVEYLAHPGFNFKTFGVDVSQVAIERCVERLERFPGIRDRLRVLTSQQLPFDSQFFALVTCFDVLEHLDEGDIQESIQEIDRVLRAGGTFFGSVSLRESGSKDLHGDNLHRTVRSIDWWIEQLEPDSGSYDGVRKQFSFWKRKSFKDKTEQRSTQQAALYQKIYDENPWYGNAAEQRCPGVRLLPMYEKWLVEPIIDLGCGRGHTVEKIQELGLQAEGIDQVRLNKNMQVGDITKPIDGLEKFKTAICIDCIEHLYDDQLEGLFENMQMIPRQAFSIHIGESNGTGKELHVNRKSFEEWEELIDRHFNVKHNINVSHEQRLYLTERKILS